MSPKPGHPSAVICGEKVILSTAYNDAEKIAAFEPAGYTCHGGLTTFWPWPMSLWIVHPARSGRRTRKLT